MTHTPTSCWFRVDIAGHAHNHLTADQAHLLVSRARRTGAPYRYTFHSMTLQPSTRVITDTLGRDLPGGR